MYIVVDETKDVGKFETYDDAADFAYSYEIINDTSVMIKEVSDESIRN